MPGSAMEVPAAIKAPCSASQLAAASPIAVIAITFVGTRPDTEIATGVGAEVASILIGTLCIAVTPMPGVAILPPSRGDFFHQAGIFYVNAQRDAARLRLGWRR